MLIGQDTLQFLKTHPNANPSNLGSAQLIRSRSCLFYENMIYYTIDIYLLYLLPI